MSGLGSANKLLDYVEAKWRTFPFDAIREDVKAPTVNLRQTVADKLTPSVSVGGVFQIFIF